jgi:hypothetical protein
VTDKDYHSSERNSIVQMITTLSRIRTVLARVITAGRDVNMLATGIRGGTGAAGPGHLREK